MRLPALLSAAILTACASTPPESDEQRVRRIVDKYTPECRLAGYTVGTEPFFDCIVVAFQRDQRATDAQRRAMAAALLSSGAYKVQLPQTPLPATGGAMPGLAAQGSLVNFRLGTSVTGQSVWVCTYRIGGNQFERVIPYAAGGCPGTAAVY